MLRMRSLLLLGSALAAGSCKGSHSETQGCHTEACEVHRTCQAVDAVWAEWAAWSECECPALTHSRHRSIARESSCGGQPISGEQVQVQHCNMSMVPDSHVLCEQKSVVPAELGPWSAWSTCTCDTAQQFRTRVLAVWSRDCGDTANGDMKETKGCDRESLGCQQKQDCSFAPWAPFSECTASCGGGQQKRNRVIDKSAVLGGETCLDNVAETRACNEDCCAGEQPVDCKIGDWQPWGGCSVTCDAASRQRSREMDTYPTRGGKQCPHEALVEHEVCKDQPDCDPIIVVDGEWGEWGGWWDCTKSCGTGYKSRDRKIKRKPENGGAQPEGSFQDFEQCNTQDCESNAIDCEFGKWSNWTACSCECNGKQDSVRKIKQHADNGGMVCDGGLHRIQACNVPGTDDAHCEQIPECKWEEWAEWSECSQTCLGGSKTRARKYTPGEGVDGARNEACSGATDETTSCNDVQCFMVGENKDCEYSEWQEWSGCTKECGTGQKKREREVKQHAQLGGESCVAEAMVFSVPCNTQSCHPTAFCAWSEWQAWGACTAECGGGQQNRQRELAMVKSVDDHGDYLSTTNLVEMHKQVVALRGAYSSRTNFMAVMAGCGMLVVGAMLIRRRRAPQDFERQMQVELLERE